MSLRIAWLGPWCEQSAIAQFGLHVVMELERRGHHVTIFRSETGDLLDLPSLNGKRPVNTITEGNLGALRWSFDHVIANLGDHFGFHGALVETIETLGATMIFHDGFLLNLAGAYVRSLSTANDGLAKLVRAIYGLDISIDDVDVWSAPLELIAAQTPMTEWLAPFAAGCVIHSSIWKDRLTRACQGPVEVIQLAYKDLAPAPPRPMEDTLTIATIGTANSNKRADQVLYALASDRDLSRRCRYKLLGDITDAERTRLTELAATLEVPAPYFSERLSDEDLREALVETDVISCLRHPVLEGGSASLVTALFSARPTLVSHQAHYADVPEGLVFPCRAGEEAADVSRHLRWILDHPVEARTIGVRARQYAFETHSSGQYVDRLLDLAARATEFSPAVRTAAKFGRILGDCDSASDEPVVERISRALSSGLPVRGNGLS